MATITQPDALWLRKLLYVVQCLYEDYPELFSKDDEEVLAIAGQLIKDLK